jgi:hypothetical protein
MSTTMQGLARWLRTQADGSNAHSAAVLRWASEVEAARAALSVSEPVAWLCEFNREDESVDRQVVLENPEGTRWADCADGDGVSPFSVTPLFAHPVPKGEGEATDAAQDVLAERQRQIEAEGWTAQHDDEHDHGEMSRAAACYALGTPRVGQEPNVVTLWPWWPQWWKPKDNRSNLVRAGALILAEIERLDRARSLTQPKDAK